MALPTMDLPTYDLVVPDETGKQKMAIPASGSFQSGPLGNFFL